MESARSTLLTHAPLNTTGHLWMLIKPTGNVQSIFKNGPIAISARWLYWNGVFSTRTLVSPVKRRKEFAEHAP
jgi:hypothetical protein